MLDIKTKDGLEVSVDENNISDMRFIEAVRNVETSGTSYIDMIELAIGKDGKEKLYEFVKEEDGRIPIKKVNEVFDEIMAIATERNNKVKN